MKGRRRETLAAQRFDQPEPAERLHGVRGELNAGADRSELCRLLVDLDLKAQPYQARRRRESAYAGANDRDAGFFRRH